MRSSVVREHDDPLRIAKYFLMQGNRFSPRRRVPGSEGICLFVLVQPAGVIVSRQGDEDRKNHASPRTPLSPTPAAASPGIGRNLTCLRPCFRGNSRLDTFTFLGKALSHGFPLQRIHPNRANMTEDPDGSGPLPPVTTPYVANNLNQYTTMDSLAAPAYDANGKQHAYN